MWLEGSKLYDGKACVCGGGAILHQLTFYMQHNVSNCFRQRALKVCI